MATKTQKIAPKPATPICSGFAGPSRERLKRLADKLKVVRSGRRIRAANDTAAAAATAPMGAMVYPYTLSAINVAVANETGADGKVKPWRLAPIGEYPVALPDGRRIVQVVDREAVQKMHSAFNTWLAKIGIGAGRPVYEGHPDHPAWAKANPSVRAKAVARIQSTEVRDDGLWGTAALNDEGKALLSGPAPAFAHHSPHWILEPIAGRPAHFRPVDLVSIGLTNQPNLPPELTTVGVNEDGNKPADTYTMPPWLIALLAPLGIKAESTQAEIEAALTKLMADGKAMKEKETAAATAATTAANEITQLRTEVTALRKSRSEVAVNSLLASGKIVEADKAATITRLAALNDTEFTTELGKLTSKVAAVNTNGVFPHLAQRRQETGVGTDKISAINEAVGSYMKEKGITDRDVAWAAVKKAQPTLFT